MSALNDAVIGLYDPDGPTTGSNAVTVHMAAVLARRARTRIIVAGSMASPAALESFFGVDLNKVEFHNIAGHRPALAHPGARALPSTVVQARIWDLLMSRKYDLWIASAGYHVMPHSAARRSVLYCHFPYWSLHLPTSEPLRGLRKISSNLQRRINSGRIKSYDMILANSRFTATWVRERWGVEAPVLYPPVGSDGLTPGDKSDLIVTVGVIDPNDTKNHAATLRAFQYFVSEVGGDWRLIIAGSVGSDSESQRALRRLLEQDKTGRVEVLVNRPRSDLLHLLGKAKMYWHSKGLGNIAIPEYREHFGISTVEAMMAGCVPIVPNAGGQPEIVIDQEVGFVCNNESDMAQAGVTLARNELYRRRLATAAVQSAGRFTIDRFERRLISLLSERWPELGLSVSPSPQA